QAGANGSLRARIRAGKLHRQFLPLGRNSRDDGLARQFRRHSSAGSPGPRQRSTHEYARTGTRQLVVAAPLGAAHAGNSRSAEETDRRLRPVGPAGRRALAPTRTVRWKLDEDYRDSSGDHEISTPERASRWESNDVQGVVGGGSER